MPTHTQHELPLHGSRGELGVVLYQPSWAQGATAYDAETRKETHCFILAIGNERPGKPFFTSHQIRERIIKENLPPGHFGFMYAEIQHPFPGEKKRTIRLEKPIIQNKRYEQVLNREVIRRLLFPTVVNQIRTMLAKRSRQIERKAQKPTRKKKEIKPESKSKPDKPKKKRTFFRLLGTLTKMNVRRYQRKGTRRGK